MVSTVHLSGIRRNEVLSCSRIEREVAGRKGWKTDAQRRMRLIATPVTPAALSGSLAASLLSNP